jgi:hypothetical protein
MATLGHWLPKRRPSSADADLVGVIPSASITALALIAWQPNHFGQGGETAASPEVRR